LNVGIIALAVNVVVLAIVGVVVPRAEIAAEAVAQ
jgi:hypothetical protein